MLARPFSMLERCLGPRPRLTLVIDDMRVAEIWVEGRAPLISIHDYDWGETDPDPAFDGDGFAYSPINWRGPVWSLGLSIHPTKKETYTMARQSMKSIPLSELKVSKLNMRHGRKKPDISDILPSIRAHGLRQSLLVRQESKSYGVIAGRRRLFALKQIAKDTGIDPNVPCIVMRTGDDAEALEASLIENIARLPATEMEQYTAFKKLHDAGRAVADIADYYGVTELTVRRVMALANLSGSIRKLYSAGEVDQATIRALTLASPDQQADWLTLFESEDERAPHGRACRAWITGGDTITTDKALFDLASYEGEVRTDLFGEQGIFADVNAFWRAQSAAIAARIETYTSNGWADVIVLDRGVYFQSWDHVKRPKSKGGKVFVETRRNGETLFHEGYITSAEARRQDSKNQGTDAPNSAKPEMSGPLATYLLRHRHLAAQADLAHVPAVALRLMAAHALVGSALWQVRPQPERVAKESTAASLEAAPARKVLTEAQENAAQLFKALEAPSPRRNGDPYHLCEVFTVLLALSDAEVMTIIATTMAETLEAGSPVVEAVLHVLGTDMAAQWQPDDAFFELTRDKRAINAMLGEIGSLTLAETMLTETAKVQKQALANRIKGEGCAPKPDWRPGWMQVPPTRYVDGAPSAPADAWARISRLFEAPSDDTAAASDDDQIAA